jgi:NAD(P)-dependent dehydrogenase (short-subunit alcohol dehydrogenase family)
MGAQQVVLVTGCSHATGFGALACVELVRRGHRPYASMRDPDGRSSAQAAALKEAGVPVLALDVRDDDQVSEALAHVIGTEGRLDALVNNAAVISAGSLEETSPDRMLAAFDANVVGAHRLIRTALPHMRSAGGGTIVQVSSVNGFYPEPIMGTYSATKHAMNALADALSIEVAGFNVSVVVIEPGSFSTGVDRRTDWEPGALEPTSIYHDMVVSIWGRDPGDDSKDPFVDPAEVALAIVDSIERPPEAGAPAHVVLGADGREIDERMGHTSAIEAWRKIVDENGSAGA